MTAAMGKDRSYTDRVSNGSNRPFAALQDRPANGMEAREGGLRLMDSQSNELFSWCSPIAGSSDCSSARSASGAPWVRTNISLSAFAISRK
jgi:hypothetical protein